MGLKNWINKITAPKVVETTLPEPKETAPMPKVKKPRKPKAEKKPVPPKLEEAVDPVKLEKDAFTARGEPWVSVIGIELDAENIGSGSFNLDFNEIFVARLIKAGYKGKDDFEVVNHWFNTICRNVLSEQYEQSMADPDNRNKY